MHVGKYEPRLGTINWDLLFLLSAFECSFCSSTSVLQLEENLFRKFLRGQVLKLDVTGKTTIVSLEMVGEFFNLLILEIFTNSGLKITEALLSVTVGNLSRIPNNFMSLKDLNVLIIFL